MMTVYWLILALLVALGIFYAWCLCRIAARSDEAIERMRREQP